MAVNKSEIIKSQYLKTSDFKKLFEFCYLLGDMCCKLKYVKDYINFVKIKNLS